MYFELEAGSKDVVPLSVCEVALGDLVREADPAAASSCARAGRRHQRLSSCTGLMLNDGVGVAIVSALSVLPLVLCPHPGSARQAAPHPVLLLQPFYRPGSTGQTFQTRAQAAAIFRQIPLKFLRILVFRPFWSGLQTVDPWKAHRAGHAIFISTPG